MTKAKPVRARVAVQQWGCCKPIGKNQIFEWFDLDPNTKSFSMAVEVELDDKTFIQAWPTARCEMELSEC